jgi:hypothetical protein
VRERRERERERLHAARERERERSKKARPVGRCTERDSLHGERAKEDTTRERPGRRKIR